MPEEKVHIIGVGDDGLGGLTEMARRLIGQADLLIGTEQTLASVQPENSQCQIVPSGNDLGMITERIRNSLGQRIVVLTSGDPLFYGVARYLCDKLGKDRFEVIPHVSSMQLAFARVKESWDEAYLANLASVSLEQVVERIRSAGKVGLFTTEETPPRKIAQLLIERKIDYFTAYVCENLGSPDERVTRSNLAEIVEQKFSPLNVMVLVRMPDVPDRPREMVGSRLFGNPDELFLQSQPKRGLLTPLEVRVLALAELDLGHSSIVWDVGAGSGSVSIECARIAHHGTTYAIEMDADDHELIRENAERFGVSNLVPILGKAPDAWEELPAPDAIFVGGTGRTVGQIMETAFERLKPGGRLVVNIGSIENLSEVSSLARHLTKEVQIRMISVASATEQLERLRFESQNPTFLVSAIKEAAN